MKFIGFIPWEYVGYLVMLGMIGFIIWVIFNSVPFDWKEDINAIGDKIGK